MAVPPEGDFGIDTLCSRTSRDSAQRIVWWTDRTSQLTSKKAASTSQLSPDGSSERRCARVVSPPAHLLSPPWRPFYLPQSVGSLARASTFADLVRMLPHHRRAVQLPSYIRAVKRPQSESLTRFPSRESGFPFSESSGFQRPDPPLLGGVHTATRELRGSGSFSPETAVLPSFLTQELLRSVA